MNEPIPVFNAKWCKAYNPFEYKEKKDKTHLGWKWWRLRKQKLSQNPYCERCGLLATEVHHKLERHTHPHLVYEWTNLESICSQCHKKHHNMGGTDAV